MVELQTILPNLALLVLAKYSKKMDENEFNAKFDGYYNQLLNIKHSIPFLINIEDDKHIKFYKLLNNAIGIYTSLNENNLEQWQQNTINFSQEVGNLAVEIFNEEKLRIEKEILE